MGRGRGDWGLGVGGGGVLRGGRGGREILPVQRGRVVTVMDRQRGGTRKMAATANKDLHYVGVVVHLLPLGAPSVRELLNPA